MLKLLLFAALCVVCYKTNPDEKSFKKYMEQKRKEKTSTTSSKVLNKFNNVISQAIAPLPNFTYDNYSLCSICTLENGLIFLGICNSWYPLSGLLASITGNSGSSNPEQSSAEVEKELEEYVISGNKEKARKNFNEAGKLYIKAAQGYEKQRNTYEAAINYENAFKVYQSDENYSRAYDNAKTSAKLFASNEKTLSRAARLYESMAQLSKKQNNLKTALENYTSAINLYNRMDGNSGGMQTRLAQANLAAEMGGYNAEKAIELFEDIAKRSVDEPLLKYNVSSCIGKASLLNLNKSVNKNNFDSFPTILGKYVNSYPVFENSAEYNLCHDVDLALSTGNPDKVKELCTKYKQTHNLSEWESEILGNVINYADKKEISIL
ncbi:TPR-like protein [Neocallimastix sp. 'constans']|jgi:tetratricopeptide (TPR) repeat protein